MRKSERPRVQVRQTHFVDKGMHLLSKGKRYICSSICRGSIRIATFVSIDVREAEKSIYGRWRERARERKSERLYIPPPPLSPLVVNSIMSARYDAAVIARRIWPSCNLAVWRVCRAEFSPRERNASCRAGHSSRVDYGEVRTGIYPYPSSRGN